MLIARSGAQVQMVTVDGTPQVDPAWSSLWRSSRARVRFHPLIDYSGMPAREIGPDLRRRFMEATGWPANETVPRLIGGRWMQVDVEGRWRTVEDPSRVGIY
jgi:hypothetical protein